MKEAFNQPHRRGPRANEDGPRTRRKPYRGNESVADFTKRIAAIMRLKTTGKRYTVIGAAPAHPCLVRKAERQ